MFCYFCCGTAGFEKRNLRFEKLSRVRGSCCTFAVGWLGERQTKLGRYVVFDIEELDSMGKMNLLCKKFPLGSQLNAIYATPFIVVYLGSNELSRREENSKSMLNIL